MTTFIAATTPVLHTDYSIDMLSLVLLSVVTIGFTLMWFSNRIRIKRIRSKAVRMRELTDVIQRVSAVKNTATDHSEDEAKHELIEKYKRIFDQDIVALAFFDKEGMLITANSKMRQIMHFQGEGDPLYFGKSIFDMPTYRDLINRHNIPNLYFCTHTITPERDVNVYAEIRLHPVFTNEGQLQFISMALRDITEERELWQEVRNNNAEIVKANERIRSYEEELRYLMESCDMLVWRTSFANREITFHKTLGEYERKMSFDEFQTYFIDTDEAMAEQFRNPELYFSKPTSILCRMRPLFHSGRDMEWNALDFIPVFGKDGKLEGSFGTIRNTTSLMQAQERLKEETRRANDSGRLKSVFMANMTHEIRTPLNSIVGFSDLLPMIESPADRQEMVHVIMNNCDMLLRLINDILEISSMDANAIAIEPRNVDFAVEFDNICRSLEQRVESPTVKFIKESPCATLPFRIDVSRMQQVLTNFVTNAVKYTKEGHIKVGYQLTGSQESEIKENGLLLYCEDTGTGIPKDKQALVFERFVKLNDYVQGTGLGLSICKAIANRIGGRTGVKSEGEGKGSTFWIWIPSSNNQNNE